MHNNNQFIELFEQRLSEFTGAPYVVVTDRCTNSIILALEYTRNRKQRITVPRHCYVSVPMMIVIYGYKLAFRDDAWVGKYQIGKTNIWDCAVGIEENMYVPGEIQCLSFQQKKRLNIGKGGAILLDNEVMYRKLKRMRMDGRDPSISVEQEMQQANNDIIIGYHMNMTPDEAARGILLLNQLPPTYVNGSYKDYPDVSQLNCFKDYK
jgi:dTDP-4-amino-4,6-dideoxygalactose transaminase